MFTVHAHCLRRDQASWVTPEPLVQKDHKSWTRPEAAALLSWHEVCTLMLLIKRLPSILTYFLTARTLAQTAASKTFLNTLFGVLAGFVCGLDAAQGWQLYG